ncbi:MAG: rhomboid family intramembrane serine protease [Pseudomonadota bacterium]
MTVESPFHKLPPVVVGLALLIVGIEAVFQMGEANLVGDPRSVGWRLTAVETFAYSPAVLDRVLVAGDYSPDLLWRFVTYPFINQSILQVAFCAALTLALGNFTASFYGQWRVLVVFVVTSIVGAIVYGLLVEGRYPLLGGFTPAYGLIGAYTYALWLRLGRAGAQQVLAFRLIGVLLLIQLIYGVVFGLMSAAPPPPHWIAELSGFVAGFVLSVLLAPGGWSLFLARMRRRS